MITSSFHAGIGKLSEMCESRPSMLEKSLLKSNPFAYFIIITRDRSRKSLTLYALSRTLYAAALRFLRFEEKSNPFQTIENRFLSQYIYFIKLHYF